MALLKEIKSPQNLKYQIILFTLLLNFAFCQPGNIDSTTEKIRKCISDSVGNKYGCSVWISNSNFVFNEGFGYLDREMKYKTDYGANSALFNIASITKTITAIGILKLYENGQLNLEDTISKFFANVPMDKKKITIHQLLTHTSGLQQNYVADDIGDRDTAVERILNDTLAFEPGTDFSYSNENYVLLAAIIEIITKKKYEMYIRYDILSGWSGIFFWDELKNMDVKQIASKLKYLSPKTLERNWGFIGSGGMYSSAPELFMLYEAIKKHRLLNENNSKLLFNSYFQLESGIDVCYGWFSNKTAWGTKEYWTRGSEDFGHNAVIRWFPEDDNTVIIVCSNSGEMYGPTGTANKTISDAIISLIFNDKKKN